MGVQVWVIMRVLLSAPACIEQPNNKFVPLLLPTINEFRVLRALLLLIRYWPRKELKRLILVCCDFRLLANRTLVYVLSKCFGNKKLPEISERSIFIPHTSQMASILCELERNWVKMQKVWKKNLGLGSQRPVGVYASMKVFQMNDF